MRDKLIELVLDYCTAPGKYASLGDERKFPYKTTELKKYSNEYLLELLEDFLEYKSLDITAMAKDNFRNDLETIINRHSKENGSDTPDFFLAEYLEGCLDVFDKTVSAREKWYGRGPTPVHTDDILFGERDDLLYGHVELDPLFPVDSHYSDWDGRRRDRDSPIDNNKKVK